MSSLKISSGSELPEPPTSWVYPPEMGEARVETYRQMGEVELDAYIFEPEGHSPSDHRPAVLFFFGGGWIGGSPGQFLPQCRYLAYRGMVSIAIDYRVKNRHGSSPLDSVTDAKAAIRWVRAHAKRLGVDPDRIVASGGSAGGHLAAATALVTGFEEGEYTEFSSLPNALLLFNPVLILAPVEGHPDLLSTTNVTALQELNGDDAKLISPYHFIRPGLPPSLLFHGMADKVVPYATAKQFHKKMVEAGNRCELKAYEGQPHGFFNPGRGTGEARAEATRYYYETIRQLDAFLVSLGYLSSPPLPVP